MRSRWTARKKVRGNSSDSRGRMTTAPPADRVGNKVPNEPSKWNGETHKVRVPRSRPSASAVERTAARNAPLPITTPLGEPVVPDV